jgi:hypothetical protein
MTHPANGKCATYFFMGVMPQHAMSPVRHFPFEPVDASVNVAVIMMLRRRNPKKQTILL